MANAVKFEGKERRMAKIEKCLAESKDWFGNAGQLYFF